MKNGEIIQRYDALYSERKGNVESIWELIERFVLPLRGEFYSTLNSEGELDWHRRDIYDSTAIFACQSLAASLHGNLTSPGQTWFELRFRDEELNEADEPKEWLDSVTKIIYNAVNESNFDIEIAEAYLDLVGFGTSVLIEELDEETGMLNFSAIPVREIYFEEDDKKQVAKLYRRLQWTPLQIISKFGEKNVPDRINKLAEDPSSSTTREDVIFALYPRKTSKDIDTGKPLAPKVRPVGYKYVLKNGQETLGEEGGFYEMPAFVARWRKSAGSRWGHSPATIALADILTLNQIKEATLEAAGKAIDPANLAEAGNIIGDMELDKGGLTIVTDINGLKPYESGSKFDISNLEIGMLTESIRKAFFQDQLELKDSPAMTATEANIRYELMQRLLGPTFGRVKTDMLDPLIQRAFNILFRGGLLPEVPQGLEEADIDISYSGPLARSQKYDAAATVQEFIMQIAQMAEIFPDAMDILDVDGAVRAIANARGVPAKALKGDAEIEEIRKARAEQQQAAQQTQQAQEMGAAMENVGKGGEALAAVPDDMKQALAQMGGQ